MNGITQTVAEIDKLIRRLNNLQKKGEDNSRWGVEGEIIKNDAEEFMERYFPRDSKDYARLSEALFSRVPFRGSSRWANYWWAYGGPLLEALEVVKHRLNSGQTLPMNARPEETMIGAETPHSAYVAIRDLVEQAGNSVLLVDPFVDRNLFPLLANVRTTVDVRILTRAKTMPKDFPLEAAKFSEEHKSSIKIRCGLDDSHDRFLVVDRRLYSSGASFKDLGKKLSVVFALTTLNDQLVDELERRWQEANAI